MSTSSNKTISMLFPVLAMVATVGCNGASDPAGGTARVQSVASPMTNKADGTDRADHDCTLVLRQVARAHLPDGRLETSCSQDDGRCWFVWQGTMDVVSSALSDGSVPVLLYKSSWGSQWWQVEATPVEETEGSQEGFRRFSFRLEADTAPTGGSMTSLMRTRIEVVPALVGPNGGRLFDHNRNPGDFDNYILVADNDWSVSDDPAVCPASPPQSSLFFRSDWTQHQYGALVAGGRVTIHYDPARLSQCAASTENGGPSWRILGHALFSPGGQTVSGPLTAISTDLDGRTVVVPATWTIDLPAGTTSVAFWFQTDGADCSVHWDSNFGDNFVFPILPRAPSARVQWAGDGGWVLSRGECEAAETPGIPDEITLDGWAITRADCRWIDIDVYAGGLTDARERHPEWLIAEVVVRRDGGEPLVFPLDFVDRVGNNYRYRWDLSEGLDLIYTPWDRFDYTFRFSLDGVRWFEEGRVRHLLRDSSWCPASYWGNDRCP